MILLVFRGPGASATLARMREWPRMPFASPAELLRPPLWEWFALGLGLIVGSFANVCIHRVPLRQSVVSPRSRCPRCGAPIASFDNLPVLSWLLLRGRCRQCQAPISLRYPAVEAANGALYFGLAALRGPGLATGVSMIFATILLVLSLIDYDHHLLPDVITLPGLVLGLAASFLPGAPSPREAFLSAAAGFLAFAAVAAAGRWYFGEEAIGMGDWKMAAMMGAFLGWRSLLLAIFLGSLMGSLLGLALVALGRGSRRMRLPLGTFLAIGGLAVLFTGDSLLAWYARLFHG
jgi:leader peptidase (prepilin peptidase)/N-methyltransferase